MRVFFVFVSLLVVCTWAGYGGYVPRKSSDTGVAEGKRKKVETIELGDSEAVDFVESEEESEEEPQEKKVKPKKKPVKEPKKTDTKLERRKKGDDQTQDLLSHLKIPDGTIPTLTLDELLEQHRTGRIEKIKDHVIPDIMGDKSKLDPSIPITDEHNKDIFRDDDDDNQEDTNEQYQACFPGRNELCKCENYELNCGSIKLGEDGVEHFLYSPHLYIATDPPNKGKRREIYYANFSGNEISKLEKDKIVNDYVSALSYLDFSNNKIASIESDAFSGFTNLTKLYLNGNKLKQVNRKWFEPIGETLLKLDLSNNKITTLDDNCFKELNSLKKLVLDGNPIKGFKKEMFRGLENLEELSLDNCNIEELPADIFQFLKNLKGISLAGNPITDVPKAVETTDTLEEIDLSGTDISELHEKAFGGHEGVKEIFLENMPYLAAVRDCAFCGLINLQTLEFSGSSNLSEIHPNAFGFVESDPGDKVTKLETFKIDKCNLSTISEHLLDWDQVKLFTISGNRWQCDCETAFFIGSPSKLFEFESDISTPRCQGPESVKNKRVTELKDYEACATVSNEHRSARMSKLLFFVLFAVFAGIGGYYVVTTGKLRQWATRIQTTVPTQVSYSNLNNREDTLNLDGDFEPRPAEV